MKKWVLCLTIICISAALQAQNDLALSAPLGSISRPVSGCALSSTQNVTVEIFNSGATLPAGTSFTVSYSINAGAPVTELVTLGSTLLKNSRFSYTFTTTANLSVPGSYNFTATVSIAGDVNPNNNTYTGYTVINSANSTGGSISGSTSACASGNSGSLTLSGHTGTVLRWEYSTDNGTTWYYVSNTSSTQSYLNLKTTTSYRAVIQNGSCGTVFSTIAIITINC